MTTLGKKIQRSIQIDAAPEHVWDVLTDFPAHPEWNPFIRHISGTAEVGSRLEVHIAAPGGKVMKFKPVVTAATPTREFAWLGKLGIRGIFDGAHSFVLEEHHPERTIVTQTELFTGVLVPLLGAGLNKTADGFDEMNRALKQRCELTAGRAGHVSRGGTDQRSL